MSASAATLPPLRDDLVLYSQPKDLLGEATAMIYDPLRHCYFRISGEALSIVRRWGEGEAGHIRKLVHAENQYAPEDDDIKRVQAFLADNFLLQGQDGSESQFAAKAEAMRKRSMWTTVLHSYLFFRVPLLRPADFLERIAPWFRYAFLPVFWIAILLLALTGAYFVSREWDGFAAAGLAQLSAGGIATIGVVLLLLKLVHELGHAITATRFGCRVPTMGLAFMLMAPLFYTDTTNAWRLRNRGQRMRITIAGVAAEMIVAALALFLWAFLPEGLMRSFAFTLAVTAPITTIVINLNPCMRFDGYFLLMDYWKIENLQSRAFAFARWRMREILFAFGDAPPEALPAPMVRKLVVYAWSTWIYRFVLFLGIAILIYSYFTKVLGIALFVIEIGYFVALPVVREIGVWWSRRAAIAGGKRGIVILTAFLLSLGLFFYPWSSSARMPALLLPYDDVAVYPKSSGNILEVAKLRNGQRVSRGDVLLRMDSPEVESQIKQAKYSRSLLEKRLARISADALDRTQYRVLLMNLSSIKEKLRGFERLRDELVVRASFDGVLVDVDHRLRVGQWIRSNQPLARIINPSKLTVRAAADESSVRIVRSGSPAKFVPDAVTGASVTIRLVRIDRANERILALPSLAAVHGGWIPVSAGKKGELKPLRPVFAVHFTVPGYELSASRGRVPQVLRGVAIVEGRAESIAFKAWRQVARVLVRESGF